MADIIDEKIKRMLADLYKSAKKKGNLREGKYLEDRFPYVEIDSSEFPKNAPKKKFACSLYTASNKEIKEVISEREIVGAADAYKALVKEGKFLIFIFRDQVPEEFRQVEAAHEYVEGFTRNHANGRKAEFEEAQYRGPEFFKKYLIWFAKNFPALEDEKSKKIFLEQIIPKEGISILKEEMYIAY